MAFLKSTVLLFICLVFSSNAPLHNPLLATYEITESEGKWSINISSSQEGTDNAMLKYYGGINLQKLEQPKYKQLLLKYIKATTQITANEQDMVKLGKGKIKIDRHKIELQFVLKNIPEKLNQLDFEVKTFAENPGHFNIVKFMAKDKREALVLSQKNNFTKSISFLEPTLKQ